MTKYIYRIAILFSFTFLFYSTSLSQELPVAVGPENTYVGGGDYDGTNFLMSMVNVVNGQYKIELQLIGPGPSLVGPRISTGKIGSGMKIAFDGTNYLMVWTDPFPFFGSDTNGIGNLYGQLISKTGQLVGNTFNIVSDVNIKFGNGRGTLSFNGSNYLLTYLKGGHHVDYLYSQVISTSGTLIGSPVKVSNNFARDHAIGFDGSNYLVAWCEGSGVDEFIYGQLISNTGQLIGNNFLIDNSSAKSDNPLSIDFDGNSFIVLFHDRAINGQQWNIFARSVTVWGIVSSESKLILDASLSPMAPMGYFDGNEHLVTWIQVGNPTVVKGRFFDINGDPLGNIFTAFDTLGGKFAFGGVSGYIPGHFILACMRIDTLYSDCDIYVKGLDPLTGIANENGSIPGEFVLNQNYPNPFNPGTVLKYSLPSYGTVSISVYDVLGTKIKTLVSEQQQAGDHEIYFDASGLAGGVYFYSVNYTASGGTKSYSSARKMIYLR